MATEHFKQTFLTRFEGSPIGPDLTCESHLHSVTSLAEDILRYEPDADALAALEAELSADKEKVPLLIHMGLKVARSRALVAAIEESTRVSVVFAVYEEHERILRTDEHPHGEDFLRRKVEQMSWLFDTHANFSWELILVDDGCPEGSGRIAQAIATEEGFGDRVRVLHLADAIENGEEVTHPMQEVSESQKGGSVAYGMTEAVRSGHPNQVVVFTDADLSTHLGQVGLLVDPILRGGADAAIGSRCEPTSVAIEQGMRHPRGKLFIYMWKRLFPLLGRVIDTQCGFKAFRGSCVDDLTASMIEKKFAFDIELLLRTVLNRGHSMEKVAIAWIDSAAALRPPDVEPYLPMLRQMVAMYRVYLHPSAEADSFADFIERLDDDSWERLTKAVPSQIADREPADFASWNGVTPEELQAAIDR